MVAGSCFPFSEVFFFLQDPAVRVPNRCFMCCSQLFPKGAATIGFLNRPFLVVCWCRNGQAGGVSRRCYGEWGTDTSERWPGLRVPDPERSRPGSVGDVFIERSALQATNHSNDGLIQKAAGSDPSVGLGERAADYGSSLGLGDKMHCNRDPRWHPNCAFFFFFLDT